GLAECETGLGKRSTSRAEAALKKSSSDRYAPVGRMMLVLFTLVSRTAPTRWQSAGPRLERSEFSHAGRTGGDHDTGGDKLASPRCGNGWLRHIQLGRYGTISASAC